MSKMSTTFITDLLQSIHSTHFGRLLDKAVEEERYEHADLIKKEIDRRVTLGFMRYLEDGITAVPVEVVGTFSVDDLTNNVED